MDSEKSMDSFAIKKKSSPNYLLRDYFSSWFVDNFLELLWWKINVFDIFNTVDF